MKNFNFWLKKAEEEMRLRNYSASTIKNYLYCLKEYFCYLGNNYQKIDENKIRVFLINKQESGVAAQTVNQYLNAIKFFYYNIIKKHNKIDIRFAKRPNKLPIVFSKNEINQIINNISNEKHKLLISLAYGSGLRVSEVVKLKVKDIDLENSIINIRQSKGKKDRITVFPYKLKDCVYKIIKYRDKNDFIFHSMHGGRLTERTAQKIFKNALNKAEIKKDASFHSLRHFFATHLLENGTDIRYIQELLGHNNIRTTQIYTRITNYGLRGIKSPL